MATLRLVRAAERAGARRFVFFSALGAEHHSRTRFFRAKALATDAVEASELETVVFAPSIVYAPGDPWITLLERFSYLPAIPVSGAGPLALPADLGRGRGRLRDGRPVARTADRRTAATSWPGRRRSPTSRSCGWRCRANGRRRRLLNVPLPVVRGSLRALGRVAGPKAFATWEEAELMEEPMTTPRGTADAERLGVSPLPMDAVLGGA